MAVHSEVLVGFVDEAPSRDVWPSVKRVIESFLKQFSEGAEIANVSLERRSRDMILYDEYAGYRR